MEISKSTGQDWTKLNQEPVTAAHRAQPTMGNETTLLAPAAILFIVTHLSFSVSAFPSLVIASVFSSTLSILMVTCPLWWLNWAGGRGPSRWARTFFLYPLPNFQTLSRRFHAPSRSPSLRFTRCFPLFNSHPPTNQAHGPSKNPSMKRSLAGGVLSILARRVIRAWLGAEAEILRRVG